MLSVFYSGSLLSYMHSIIISYILQKGRWSSNLVKIIKHNQGISVPGQWWLVFLASMPQVQTSGILEWFCSAVVQPYLFIKFIKLGCRMQCWRETGFRPASSISRHMLPCFYSGCCSLMLPVSRGFVWSKQCLPIHTSPGICSHTVLHPCLNKHSGPLWQQ